jgi:transposase
LTIRRIVSAIVFVIKNGLRWRDAPPGYGPHKTVSHISARPRHPAQDERIVEAFKKLPARAEGSSPRHLRDDAGRDLVPDAMEPAKLHRLEAGDGAGLLAFIAGLRCRLDPPDDVSTLVASCFEAGRDGFWLHRLLTAHGVINHVVEPTSILVTRGARRAKTDRLDAVGLLRVLAAKFAGDPGACRTVVVPSVEEEDAKRPHREREFLVQERVRIENRIAALLATQGVRERPSLRS